MKFWVLYNENIEVIGCELTKREAVEKAGARGLEQGEFSVGWVDVDVSAESIRRLLGNLGGYANASGEIQ